LKTDSVRFVLGNQIQTVGTGKKSKIPFYPKKVEVEDVLYYPLYLAAVVHRINSP
jgi:hypothetical protein